MSSLSKKAGLLVVANLMKYAVGFLAPMLLVRLLSQHDYGIYQQLSLIGSIGTGIMILGLPTSVYYFYELSSSRAAGRPTLIAQTQVMLLLAGTFAGIAIYFGAPVIADRFNNQALLLFLPLYAWHVGLMISGEHFTHVMVSQNRYAIAVLLEMLETTVRVGLIVAVLFFGLELRELIFALVCYAAARLVVRSWWLFDGPDSVLQTKWSAIFPLQQLGYALPLAATGAVAMLGNTFDRMIVAANFTPIDYAVYSVGALEIPLDVIFQASVANVLRASLPALVQRGQIDEVIRIWRAAVRKLSLVIVPSVVYLMAFAGLFITTLFTHAYDGSAGVFRVYVAVLPLHMLVVSVVPQVFGRTRLNLAVIVVAAGSNIALCFLLLHWIGLLGPAAAYVCSSYIATGLYLVVTLKLLNTSLTKLMPFRDIGRALLASVVALVPALLAGELVTTGIFRLASTGIVFAIAYPLGAYLCGAVTASEIGEARAWLRPILAKVRVFGRA